VATKAKKKDKPKILSRAKIDLVLSGCEELEGVVFDKAVFLLNGLVRAHAFESGNRQTAFLVMKYFLLLNNEETNISDDPSNARIMLGIREGYYSADEIKEWIKNGKIREFKR
jgi:prophage maintenance system killer protein